MTNRATQTTPAAPRAHNRLFGTDPFDLDVSRVVGGRKFSTTSATLACVIACSGTSQVADFHYERTGLYLSPRGQWFVAGKGGACSHWGRRAIDGSRDPGEGLQLISQTEARRLLEQHGGPAEAFFASEEG
jgi:hypothetical protein